MISLKQEIDIAYKYLDSLYINASESYASMFAYSYPTNLPYTPTRDVILSLSRMGFHLHEIIPALDEMGRQKRRPNITPAWVWENMEAPRVIYALWLQIVGDEEKITLTRQAIDSFQRAEAEQTHRKRVKVSNLKQGDLVLSLSYDSVRVVDKVAAGLERVRVYWTDSSTEFFEPDTEFEVGNG